MFGMFDIKLVDIYNLSTLCMLASVYTSEHSMTTLGLNVTVVFVSKTPFPLAPTTAMLPLLPRRWSLINILLNIYSGLHAVFCLYLWAFDDDPRPECGVAIRYWQGKLPLGPDHCHVAAVAAGHWATLVASRGRPALYTRQAPAVSAVSQPATSGRGSGAGLRHRVYCLQLSMALITFLGTQG